jgi:hypothetical protein
MLHSTDQRVPSLSKACRGGGHSFEWRASEQVGERVDGLSELGERLYTEMNEEEGCSREREREKEREREGVVCVCVCPRLKEEESEGESESCT